MPLFPILYLLSFFVFTKPYSQNSLYILINNIFAIGREAEKNYRYYMCPMQFLPFLGKYHLQNILSFYTIYNEHFLTASVL